MALFLPVGRKCNAVGCRKCRLFLVLTLWLASEALLKSTGKRLLQERTKFITAQCYFAWNSTGCFDSHPGKKIFSEDFYFLNCNAVAMGK